MRKVVTWGWLVAVLAGCLSLGSCATTSGEGSGQCAARLQIGEHLYLGYGNVRRDPEVTARLVTAVLPGCEDGGAHGVTLAESDEIVRARQLSGVPVRVAVEWHGSIYVRQGEQPPVLAQRWFRPPRCTHHGTVTLTADWLGILGPGDRTWDGDLGRPYLLEVHVVAGPYQRTWIDLYGGSGTRTNLDPQTSSRTLNGGGQVRAGVRCRDGRFLATTITALPLG